MAKCFVEIRKTAAKGTDSIAADIMRHLHTRQHLGKAAIICSQPVATLAAARKQWLKLSRAIQKQRASTLNADKILKYTHTIAHMQHMQFTAKSPLENPAADIYFVSPDSITPMPVNCLSTYILDELPLVDAETIIAQLPADALIIDYNQRTPWEERLDMQPKSALEERVHTEWRQVLHFLQSYDIDIANLVSDDIHNVEAMDDALDALLEVSQKFLKVANQFQRALELARPLRIHKATRTQYDSLVLLAYRVQALSPGAFTQHFLETYNEDDTFFLYDAARARVLSADTLAAAYVRHIAAGRYRLATAIRQLAAGTSAMQSPAPGATSPQYAAPFPGHSSI
jgi:hypothetical protein